MKKISQIKTFIAKWQGKGKEKQDTHHFWEELIELVLEVEHGRDILDFEKDAPVSVVHVEDGENIKWIDCYVKSSKCVIEQKSSNVSLDKKTSCYFDEKGVKHEINALQQAQLYYNRLNQSEQGRYYIACNFKEFAVVDNEYKQNAPKYFELKDLQKNIRFLFRVLSGEQNKEEQDDIQDATAKTASSFVKKLYDLLKSQYKSSEITNDILHQLNVFCVRIVFCLYADDDELFEDGQFHTFLETFSAKKLEEKFRWLFKAINYEPKQRDQALDKEIMAFRKVNGGLFRDDVAIPRLSEEIKDFILHGSDNLLMPGKEGIPFHWSQISPTNFGGIFESTLDPETRKKNGMHYTTPKNIHKVIDPLFLNDLNEKLDSILDMPYETKAEQTKRNKTLADFRIEIASLRFLDPACGSGNFLTETFKSLRRLEMKIIKELPNYGLEGTELRNEEGAFLVSPCKVSIDQFYGIELNDFASQVALCALWISECQMTTEAEKLFNDTIDRLPLKTNSNIKCADALTTDWSNVVKPKKLNYIIGNPPFMGSSEIKESGFQPSFDNVVLGVKNKEGKSIWKTSGNMDYVCAWYIKAAEFMKENKNIKCSFVSTNSIIQGIQNSLLLKPLMTEYGIEIIYAWKTFRWDNEAQVHCVIIGFQIQKKRNIIIPKYIYSEYEEQKQVTRINNYLIDAENLFIKSSTKNISPCAPIKQYGNKPTDGSFLFLTADERKEWINKEPFIECCIAKVTGAHEYLNGIDRYCLWLQNVSPSILQSSVLIQDRLKKVRDYRIKSTKAQTRESASKPYLFQEIRQTKTKDYIIIPRHTSQKYEYIPFGYPTEDMIVTDAVSIIPDASLYDLGILCSRIHMAWVKLVCGRIKSDYRYSLEIVYTNFPWPVTENESIKAEVELNAQSIINARNQHPDCTLAQLYDPLTMPSDLVDAHRANDKAVFAAYAYLGIRPEMTDEEIALILLRESIRLANISKKKPKRKKKTKKANKK